jgi:branched-chain amino acid transport system ATP-binding protein
MLTLEAIGKRFGGLRALDNVSLTIEAGSVTALIGPNGAGKTTLFSIMAGALGPSSGRVQFRGRDITGLAPDAVCRLGIGRTFQVVRPFWGLTVRDHLRAAASFGPRRPPGWQPPEGFRPLSVDEALDLTGLRPRAEDGAGVLTLADCRRLEIARAAAAGAILMLLDETMAGLTAEETQAAIALVRELRELGRTIVLIEHVMPAVTGLCDRAVVLDHGEVIADGAPLDVLASERVRRAYLGE